MTATTTPRRVLIVEHERVVALDLREALGELGYHVVGTAATSEEALRMAERERPELVLMDIRITGDRDAIYTAGVLRTRHLVPVVYLTANADEATRHRALDSEPAGYLVKPFNPHSLRTTIEVAVRRHDAELARQRAHDAERTRLELEAVAISRVASRFRKEATLDPLTGLCNRRHLAFVMTREMKFARRDHHAVGVILLGVDRFKRLNDTFGHAMGDAALQAIGDLLRARLRVYDTGSRYRGDQFVVVTPGEETSGALALAEHLRASIESLVVAHRDAAVRITASFGVAAFPRHGRDPDAVLRAAEAALDRAKADGRNRVVSAPVAAA